MHPVNFDNCVLHLEPARSEVNVLNSQAGCLAPAKTTIRKHLHEKSVAVSLTTVYPIAERIDSAGEVPDFVMTEIPLGRLSCLREVQPMGRLAGSRPSFTAIWRLPESTLTILRTVDGDWVFEGLPAHACTAPWVNDPSGYPPSFGLM